MLTIVIRTLIIYAAVTAAMRLMGKRQVGDLQTSELVIALIISEIASLPLENPNRPLLGSLIPVMVLAVIEVAVSLLMMRSRKFRGLICGHPVVVIKDGKMIKGEMNRLRISREDVLSLLRQQEIFDTADIRYAIIEPNGSLSVMKNDEPASDIESRDMREELEHIEAPDQSLSSNDAENSKEATS